MNKTCETCLYKSVKDICSLYDKQVYIICVLPCGHFGECITGYMYACVDYKEKKEVIHSG